jgi:hypothetical protein
MRSKKSNNIWLQPQSKGASQTGLFALIILDFSLKQGKRIQRWKVPRRMKKSLCREKAPATGHKRPANERRFAGTAWLFFTPPV